MPISMSKQQELGLSADLSLLRGGREALAAPVIRLLERIDAGGSMAQAAKDCGISYRTAWKMIEQLNNQSAAPLVVRSAGGQSGGGTVLTQNGRHLIAIYRAAEAEHLRFVELLGERMSEYQTYSKFIRRWFMKTSVRNQLHGSIQLVSKGAVNTEVLIGIGGEDRLTAIITNDGAEEMGLELGMDVSALIRESSIMLCTGAHRPAISARNRLQGKVSQCHEGAVCSEVSVELPGAKVITAMITLESLSEMNLKQGMPVWVCFKAFDVILAAQG